MPGSFYRSTGKRAVDLLIGVPLLVLTLPAMALMALAVRLSLGSPILFRQTRTGLGGRAFTLIKFRTMSDRRDEAGNLLPDEERLTRLGRFLRVGFDELPSLWNVLRGEMSLVGPRPLLVEYLDLYTTRQARRHDVKPGLTGWPQVNGRNALEWDEKLELDAWYADHCGFRLDLKILLLTPGRILRRQGVSAPGHATTPYFQGSDKRDAA